MNQNIQLEIQELTNEINQHNHNYYDLDNPVISDAEYDALMRRLIKLEEEFPMFALADSPTKRVGGTVSKGFNSFEHVIPMESLNDVFSFEELKDFDERVRSLAEGDIEYVVELKIDGLSVSLEYKNGVLIRGLTRGDGRFGEDITQNLKVIDSVPRKIKTTAESLTVRGEVYISKSNFALLNERQELSGKPPFANARNCAAGSLKQLDSKITAERRLDILIFNIQHISGYTLTKHTEGLDYLEKLGFCVSPKRSVFNNIEDAFAEIQAIGDKRSEFPFDIDGAVVKLNSYQQREALGSTSKAPRWAAAYKYPAERKMTIIKGIALQVGRTGAVTPNAILEPVKIAGSVVSRATLHNLDIITQKDIRVGDTVIIQKAGDIIPEVVEPVLEKRNGTEQEFSMPEYCPVCGGELIREKKAAIYRCISNQCAAQKMRGIIHFVSRDAMDIEGCGIAVIQQLIDCRLIDNAADLYYLELGDILKLDRFAEKSASNLINAIQTSKAAGLDRFLYGLGIRHIGAKSARLIAENFPDIELLMNADITDLTDIHEIGSIMAESLISYFKASSTREQIDRFRNAGVVLTYESKITDNKFDGKIFVLTGTLTRFTRSEATAAIESRGGRVSGSVSKKTSYVVAGDVGAGSKRDKAIALNVPVINEDELTTMLED